jgi:hypothetical protein
LIEDHLSNLGAIEKTYDQKLAAMKRKKSQRKAELGFYGLAQ